MLLNILYFYGKKMKNKKFDFMISESKENKIMPVMFSNKQGSMFGYENDDLLRMMFTFILSSEIPSKMKGDLIALGWSAINYSVPYFIPKNTFSINSLLKKEDLRNHKLLLFNKKQKFEYFVKSNTYNLHYHSYNTDVYLPRMYVIIKKFFKCKVDNSYRISVQNSLNHINFLVRYNFVCRLPTNLYPLLNIILNHINCNINDIENFIQYYIKTSDSNYKKFFKNFKINYQDLIKYIKMYYFDKGKIKYTIVRLDILQSIFDIIINFPDFRKYYSTNHFNWLEDEKQKI